MTDAQFWSGRRTLVTGCTGLLGTAVARELLSRGAYVAGLVRDRIPDGDYQRDPRFRQVHLVRGRVEDRFRIQSALAIHKIETVFHLVSPTDASPLDRGTATVLSALQGHGTVIPLVTARPLPRLGIAGANEATPMKCPVPWGVAEFGEIFGGGDRRTFRAVPGAIVSHLLGDRSLSVVEPGPAKDFIYAIDAARACLMLAESLAARPQPGQTVASFRTGWVYTDAEIAGVARSLAANAQPARLAETRAESGLAWKPAVTLAEGLNETISWYRDFLRSRFFGTRSAVLSPRAVA